MPLQPVSKTSRRACRFRWADFDHDGHFDMYVSNMFSTAGQRNHDHRRSSRGRSLQTTSPSYNASRAETRLFRNATRISALPMSALKRMSQWGDGLGVRLFADINNDSWDDLLVANGFLTTADTDTTCEASSGGRSCRKLLKPPPGSTTSTPMQNRLRS